MTALVPTAGPAAPPRHRRTRMAWITWRQHRAALAGSGLLLAVCVLALGVTGLRMQSAYAAMVRGGCALPADVASARCGQLWGAYYNAGSPLAGNIPLLAIALKVIPVLIGAFIGAPLLAREFEAGTFRFAWTQAVGRTHWVAVKLGLLGAALVGAAGAFGALAGWWLLLADRVMADSRWQPWQFGLTAIAFAGWMLLMFAAGVFAGAAIKRTVPAMAATAAGGACLLWLTVEKLTPRLTSYAPLTARAGLLPATIATEAGAFPVGGSVATTPAGGSALTIWFTGRHGQVISSASNSVSPLWNLRPSAQPGWLASHHLTLWISYESASRFWLFQSVLGAAGLVIALVLVAAAVWLARRAA